MWLGFEVSGKAFRCGVELSLAEMAFIWRQIYCISFVFSCQHLDASFGQVVVKRVLGLGFAVKI